VFACLGNHHPLPLLTDELNAQRQEIGEGTRNLVICIHGWNNLPVNNRYSDTDEWAWLVSKIKPACSQTPLIRGRSFFTIGIKMPTPAGLILMGIPLVVALPQARLAAKNADDHGRTLGSRLPKSLRRVHFIAHSAGAWCALEAAVDLLDQNPYVVIQITLLDPFIPEAVSSTGSSLTKSSIQALANLPASNRIWLLEITMQMIFQPESQQFGLWARRRFLRGVRLV